MMHMLKQGLLHTLLKAAEAGGRRRLRAAAVGGRAAAALAGCGPASWMLQHAPASMHAFALPTLLGAGTLAPGDAAAALGHGLQAALDAVSAAAGPLQAAEEPHSYWASVLSGQSAVRLVLLPHALLQTAPRAACRRRSLGARQRPTRLPAVPPHLPPDLGPHPAGAHRGSLPGRPAAPGGHLPHPPALPDDRGVGAGHRRVGGPGRRAGCAAGAGGGALADVWAGRGAHHGLDEPGGVGGGDSSPDALLAAPPSASFSASLLRPSRCPPARPPCRSGSACGCATASSCCGWRPFTTHPTGKAGREGRAGQGRACCCNVGRRCCLPDAVGCQMLWFSTHDR